MMRAARDLAKDHPGEVIFLDFGGLDFDESQRISPQMPNRLFWQKVLDTGFDDFAALMAPSEVILCEGAPSGSSGPSSGADAKLYEAIFGDEYPDTRFITAGNSHSVENDRLALIEAMQSLVKGTTVRRLIDRDDLSDIEIEERKVAGVAVLSRRHIESYLFDDAVIRALAQEARLPEKADVLIARKNELLADANSTRNRPIDDVKASSGALTNTLKQELKLTKAGGTVKDFMRVTLAPILRCSPAIYAELRNDIFGGIKTK